MPRLVCFLLVGLVTFAVPSPISTVAASWPEEVPSHVLAVTDDQPGEQPLSESQAMLAFIVFLLSIVLIFTRLRWLLLFWLIAYLILGDLALIAILSVLFLLWMGLKGIFGSDC